ncbi:hypothetical protein ACTXMG_00235 [Corynebacterium flavescens]|uniref:hypothetical protein n=1 Tax=Corynebacterium flavescens TaxID=28028 RepID=UPI003FD40EFD
MSESFIHPGSGAASEPASLNLRSHVFSEGWARRPIVVRRPGGGNSGRIIVRLGPVRVDLRPSEACALADLLVDVAETKPARPRRRRSGGRRA